jgi:hypothetical protein
MKKNGKSAKPNTGERGTSRAKASEPTQRRKPLGSKSGSQKRKNHRLARDHRDTNYSLDANLEQCRQKGEKYQKIARRSHRALYEALVPIYKATVEAHANDGVDELRSKIISLYDHKATRASILHSMMISVYLAIDPKTASTYGAALDFAQAKGIKLNQLITFLKEEGGVYECADELSDLDLKKKSRRKAKEITDEAVLPITFSDHKISKIKLGPGHSKIYRRALKMGEMELTMTGPLEQDGTMLVKHFKARPTEASKAILRGILETPMPISALRRRAQIWADTGR